MEMTQRALNCQCIMTCNHLGKSADPRKIGRVRVIAYMNHIRAPDQTRKSRPEQYELVNVSQPLSKPVPRRQQLPGQTPRLNQAHFMPCALPLPFPKCCVAPHARRTIRRIISDQYDLHFFYFSSVRKNVPSLRGAQLARRPAFSAVQTPASDFQSTGRSGPGRLSA